MDELNQTLQMVAKILDGMINEDFPSPYGRRGFTIIILDPQKDGSASAEHVSNFGPDEFKLLITSMAGDSDEEV